MSEREWRFHVDDMIAFAERVLEYTKGLDQAAFVSNRLVYDATIRNLTLLGEAARGIPDDVRGRHVDIPWRQMIATRNRLIHAYLGIDDDILWSIVRDDVPSLLSQLRQIDD